MTPTLLLFLTSLAVASGFRCYTCNNSPGEDDSKHCSQQVETCPKGVESCSHVVYRSKTDQKLHQRKFCTSPGTPIYQYLMFFPGGALCQNIDTANDHTTFDAEFPEDNVKRTHRARRGAFPPAPPHAQSNSLLCVCTRELCNEGGWKDVAEKTLFGNIESSGSGPKPPAGIGNLQSLD
uniref:UPAR/Ly6 domain-containing protein n=1 Tax=Steinernema glaseri TaxID=37863 RepID=A0A1I7ZWG7_9BILA